MPHPAATRAPTSADRVGREIDHERTRGALQQVAIPPCPDRLAELQRAMAGAEPDLGTVARIASSDVAMSATLIRNANGALYLAGQPVQTVGQAMNRLGLNQTVAIMTGFLVRHALPVDSPHLRRFWERSSLRALAMGVIAREIPGLAPDVAHTFGLFCHVGLPVLLQSVRGYGGTLVEAAARIDRSFVATENANHRTDHAVVGALVARVWRLAPDAMAAIRLHHDLGLIGGDDVDAEVQTLMAAGLVAEHLARRHEAQDAEREWTEHGDAALAWLQADGEDVEHWLDRLDELADAG